ncbi:hypothetical protein GCM10011371_30230 [Novosphingobium marinum]|nr:hypothetical protein GCM10011371_30230 [Novosphingobium marinum]
MRDLDAVQDFLQAAGADIRDRKTRVFCCFGGLPANAVGGHAGVTSQRRSSVAQGIRASEEKRIEGIVSGGVPRHGPNLEHRETMCLEAEV